MSTRAYTGEQKSEKRDRIIAAAENLLSLGRFQLPSINQIIQQTGDAKGTVYLYFKTKEEIYLSLLAQGLEGMMQEMAQLILRRPENIARDMAKTYIKLASARPKIYYLACVANLILDSNVSNEFMAAFKSRMLQATNALADMAVEAGYFPNQATARTKMLVCYNIFLGMWLHTHPQGPVLSVMEENGLTDLIYDFETELCDCFEKVLE